MLRMLRRSPHRNAAATLFSELCVAARDGRAAAVVVKDGVTEEELQKVKNQKLVGI